LLGKDFPHYVVRCLVTSLRKAENAMLKLIASLISSEK
jgi:hypothetical protein